MIRHILGFNEKRSEVFLKLDHLAGEGLGEMIVSNIQLKRIQMQFIWVSILYVESVKSVFREHYKYTEWRSLLIYPANKINCKKSQIDFKKMQWNVRNKYILRSVKKYIKQS